MKQTIERLKALNSTGTHASRLLQSAWKNARQSQWTDVGNCTDKLLNLLWSVLHTCDEAQVDSTWRSAYMAATILKVQARWAGAGPSVAKECLQSIDLGLMRGAAPVWGDSGDLTFRKSLLQAAAYAEECCPSLMLIPAAVPNTTMTLSSMPFPHRSLSGTLPAPATFRLPSCEWFYNKCMVPGRPTILTGVTDSWPARTSRPWSNLDYLKSVAGHRTVPVEHGKHYLDDAWEEQLITFAEYIENHIKAPAPPIGESRAYLAQHELFEQCPKLRRDIIQPKYCTLCDHDDNDEVKINAWFGPAGTLSPLHTDAYNNILAQVLGSKYVRLYEPGQTNRLYPHEPDLQQLNSQIIDPDNDPDLAVRFPRFADAPYMDFVLHEGECLYIPPHWWHFIESRETSFSVSFWW